MKAPEKDETIEKAERIAQLSRSYGMNPLKVRAKLCSQVLTYEAEKETLRVKAKFFK